MNYNALFGEPKQAAGSMALAELEDRTNTIWSYKGYAVAFGFIQYIDGDAFQTVRVWEMNGDECKLVFEMQDLCAADMQAFRAVKKWAEYNIDKLTA